MKTLCPAGSEAQIFKLCTVVSALFFRAVSRLLNISGGPGSRTPLQNELKRLINSLPVALSFATLDARGTSTITGQSYNV